MGVAPSAEIETRALYDVDGERLVVFATELFQYVSQDLSVAVGRIADGWKRPAGHELVALDLPSNGSTGVDIVAYGFAPLDTTRQAVPIADAFVRTADTCVFRLQLFVSPNAADDPEGLAALATGVLGTLTAGSRELDTGAGTCTIKGRDGQASLDLDVPDGWAAYQEQGQSFVVLRLVRMMPLGNAFADVTVYRGGHPSLRHVNAPPQTVTHVDGTLLGQAVEWHHIRTEETATPALLIREALATDGNEHVHVVVTTNEAALDPEIDAIVSSASARP